MVTIIGGWINTLDIKFKLYLPAMLTSSLSSPSDLSNTCIRKALACSMLELILSHSSDCETLNQYIPICDMINLMTI